MMLAQSAADSDNALWAGATAFFLMFVGQLGKLVTDWQKNKREARKEELDRQQVLAYNDGQLKALQEIARSNSNIREGQIEQNGKLSKVVEINKAYHEELIRSQGGICKFSGK